MTEYDWLNGDDPQRMLDWLVRQNTASVGEAKGIPTGGVSDRKLRLFAIAVERYFNSEEEDEELRARIFAKCDAAESWADGLVPFKDVMRARGFIPDAPHGCAAAVEDARAWVTLYFDEVWQPGARQFLAALLREVVGNPWRPWVDYAQCHVCGHWFGPGKSRFYRCPAVTARWRDSPAVVSPKPGSLPWPSPAAPTTSVTGAPCRSWPTRWKTPAPQTVTC